MHNTIYTDGVTNIALTKGMVRIEFGTLSITEKGADGNPAVFERHQMAMTPKVFLDTFGNMERMLNLLLDNGVVKERDSDEQREGPARDSELTLDGKDRRDPKRDRRGIVVDPRG